jgi:hypothetical protein
MSIRILPQFPTWETERRRLAFGDSRNERPSPVRLPLSATISLGHCFGLIRASGNFAASAFPLPPLHYWVASDKAVARFWKQKPLASVCPKSKELLMDANGAVRRLDKQVFSARLLA